MRLQSLLRIVLSIGGIVTLLLSPVIVDRLYRCGTYFLATRHEASPKAEFEPNEHGISLLPGLTAVPARIEFGELLADEPLTRSASLRAYNYEIADVTIDAISASCGCTVAEIKLPVTIRSGEQIEFPVRLSIGPGIEAGPLRREVRLHVGKATTIVPVHAEIVRSPQVVAKPACIEFGTVGSWERPSTSIELLYPIPSEVEFVRLSGSTKVDCQGVNRRKDGTLIIDLALSGNRQTGSHAERLILGTSKGECYVDVKWKQLDSAAYCRPQLIVWRSISDLKHVSIRCPSESERSDLHAKGDGFDIDVVVQSEKIVGDTRVFEISLALTKAPQELPFRSTIEFSTCRFEPLALMDVFFLTK